jgi:hypothetical protein
MSRSHGSIKTNGRGTWLPAIPGRDYRRLGWMCARSRHVVPVSGAEILARGHSATLLANCKRTSPQGKRNYAVLLLLARLRLRACEVVALNLNDIDWENGRITIQGKGGRRAQLRFCPECGKPFLPRDACLECGAQFQAGAKFCPECVRKLD